jgi:hypothetical protein
MEKVITLLKQRLQYEQNLLMQHRHEQKRKADTGGLAGSRFYAEPVPYDMQAIDQLETAIKIFEAISEKPSFFQQSNPIVVKVDSVDLCNKSCKHCQGNGFIIVDQPTTSLKTKHLCCGNGSFASQAFEFIYPEWWPLDKRPQPVTQLTASAVVSANTDAVPVAYAGGYPAYDGNSYPAITYVDRNGLPNCIALPPYNYGIGKRYDQ